MSSHYYSVVHSAGESKSGVPKDWGEFGSPVCQDDDSDDGSHHCENMEYYGFMVVNNKENS